MIALPTCETDLLAMPQYLNQRKFMNERHYMRLITSCRWISCSNTGRSKRLLFGLEDVWSSALE